jgi:hypothetical protein
MNRRSISMSCRDGRPFTIASPGAIALALAVALAGCAGEPGSAAPGADRSELPPEPTELAEADAALALRDRCTWTQWGRNAAHDGATCVRGQAPNQVLQQIVYDPFQLQEIEEGFGNLFVHYQVPLTDGDDNFYMMHKGGTYTSCDPPGSGEPFPCGIDPGNARNQIWFEKKYHRTRKGTFEEKWAFESDWKPFPVFLWEPMFQPALAGPVLYVPGAGGSVWQVLDVFDRPIALQRINPFPTVDPNTYVTSGITVDRFGFIYWNVMQNDPEALENRGFLVKAAPWGQTWIVDYETLIPDAPGMFDACFYTFFDASPRPPRPFPPSADALPPQFACGRQRPGVNVTPAIGRDGTIFTASTADFAPGYSYIIALRPDLSLKWATSLRGLVNDGCGVERVDSPEGNVRCSATFSAIGVDPTTNLPPALNVDDVSSSSPVVLPDGGVLYGALDNYNFSRGHMVKLDKDGRFVGAHTFGWDTTPAIYEHDGTYSIIIKDNHYVTQGPFYVAQLSKDLELEWRFQNTSTQACARQPDGSRVCSDTSPNGQRHPNGFEWCVNAPAVDARGDVYANAEDGFVYKIGQGGVLKSQTFLNQALGAAYTPISLDPSGRVLALNNGELTILGQ